MKFMEFLGWYPLAISHGLNPLLNTYVNLPHGSDMMWDTTIPFVAVTLWPVTALLGGLRISEESDHPFRRNPISCFGVFDHPLRGAEAAA